MECIMFIRYQSKWWIFPSTAPTVYDACACSGNVSEAGKRRRGFRIRLTALC